MNLRWTAATSALCAVAGFAIGWKMNTPKAPRLEPPAPAIIHKDGSRTLERTNEPPPPPLPQPPHTIARTRSATIDLAPSIEPTSLQIDLVTLDDGTQRITAKGPGITGGKDYPIGPPAPVHKWTAAVTFDGKTPGIMAMRHSGSLAYGIGAQKDRAFVFVGWRF
jgi:hypothetical protein